MLLVSVTLHNLDVRSTFKQTFEMNMLQKFIYWTNYSLQCRQIVYDRYLMVKENNCDNTNRKL